MTSERHDAPAPFGPTHWLADDAGTEGGGETVGASDAEADAVRAGGDGDLTHASRDSDGVPVGRADAEADAERSGADPDTT
jgi:hypothetical protein